MFRKTSEEKVFQAEVTELIQQSKAKSKAAPSSKTGPSKPTKAKSTKAKPKGKASKSATKASQLVQVAPVVSNSVTSEVMSVEELDETTACQILAEAFETLQVEVPDLIEVTMTASRQSNWANDCNSLTRALVRLWNSTSNSNRLTRPQASLQSEPMKKGTTARTLPSLSLIEQD